MRGYTPSESNLIVCQEARSRHVCGDMNDDNLFSLMYAWIETLALVRILA